ncbi:MAG: hypothetical protein HOM11_01720 [Methylococcales bacterium]|nr:hypothetical protein [Methylococcales bacterium]MBT7442396.1 hypothetical protein [Methylococcales bacterium]
MKSQTHGLSFLGMRIWPNYIRTRSVNWRCSHCKIRRRPEPRATGWQLEQQRVACTCFMAMWVEVIQACSRLVLLGNAMGDDINVRVVNVG